MAVTFQELKKWSGKKGFDIGKFGESKDELIKKLKKYMKNNLDDLTEEQLEWYGEQTGDKVKTKSKKKKKEKAEPKAKTKKKKKKKEEPEEEEEEVEEKKSKRKKKKKKEKKEEAVLVKSGPKELRSFAKELDISTKGYKDWDDSDWEALANKIYGEVDDMDDEDREELSKDLFTFFTVIKGQQEEEPPEEEEVEIEIPKKVQIKRWSEQLGVKTKGKEPEEIAKELLDEYKDVDDEDKSELPTALIKWGDAQLGIEPEEVEEEEEGKPLPDYKTLKGFAREVGFKIKDIKKADKHPPTLVEMIVEAYDEDDVDEYSKELVKFVGSMAPAEEVEPEEEAEPDTDELVAFLVEAGYDESDIDEWTADQLIAKLVADYKDEDDREDLPEEAIEFLKESNPELFEKKKVKKKKKKKK